MTAQLFDLSGKVALVTGGGQGIGRAIAAGLAQAGANLLICDIDESTLEPARQEIETAGNRCAAVRIDVGKPAEIDRLFATLDREFGRIDILVNNVGTVVRRRPEELTVDEWEYVLSIGAKASLQCAQHAFERMVAQGKGGSIINIMSIAGVTALGRGNMSHSMNKGAIGMMTKEMAVEWAKHGIRVNAILPCQVLTEGFQQWLDSPTFDPKLMGVFLRGIPMNRLASPEEMAGPAVFLASDAAAMVTGVLLPVDGGNLALNAGGSHTWTTA